MRSTGLSKDTYKSSLQQWLDLSVNKNVPIALLIMSRTFFLREEMVERKRDEEDISKKSVAGLADAISGLDKEVLNEVLLEIATSEEKVSDPAVRRIKLAVLSKQNELIREEEEAREAAVKKKEMEKAEAATQIDAQGDDVSVVDQVRTSTATEGVSRFDKTEETELKKDEEDVELSSELSSEEMDAISQLVLDDPVCKERAELERIKAAMKAEPEEEGAEVFQPETYTEEPVVVSDPKRPAYHISSEKADGLSPDSLTEEEKKILVEADATTTVSSYDEKEAEPMPDDVVDDPVVARLKKRLEGMVDRIDVQLSDVQVKIGDKLHILDKDKDGILEIEELATCLQQVLKRDITFDEALEFADEMDANHDGIIPVDDFIKWIENQKLVKFVEEGRDADLELMLGTPNSDKSEEQAAEVTGKA